MSTPSVLLIPDLLKAGKLYSQIPNSGAVDFDVTRATTAYRTNASGILESVASGVPRLDYPIGGGCPSLLVEPAATNILLNSQLTGGATPTSWTNVLNTGTRTPQASVLVTGQTAFRFVTSSERNIIAQSITVTSGTVYTFSFYIEQLTVIPQARQVFNFHSGATSQVWRDPDGLILDPANNLPNKLGKYTITATANDTTIVVRFGAGVQSNANADLVVVAPQLEVGSVATSYIPTAAATATRNADVISKTGVSGFIGQTEGTIYVEVDFSRAGKAFAERLIELTDDTVANRLVIAFGNNTTILTRVTTATVEQASFTATVAFGILKVALAYSSAGCVLFINGVNLASNSSATIPACTKINLGSTFAGVSQLNDRIRAAAIYPTRLTNAQLSSLTTL